jgi:hypothetical protein
MMMATSKSSLPPVGWALDSEMRSPITGIGRRDWEAVADALLDALRPYASRNEAEYRLPGPPSIHGKRANGLEGFARPFLLAAYRIRGASGKDMDALLDRYGNGLCAGVRRGGWGPHRDNSQSIVESASIAIALYETRPWLWDQFDSADQQAIGTWLAGINNVHVAFNNWLLFQVIVNEFLRSAGMRHSSDIINKNLDIVDAMYAGDGWYADGNGGNYDHYCGWAMAFYTGMWSLMREGHDRSARAARYLERLGCFVDQYQYLFGGDAEPIHIGRSLTYRWAACAPLWLAVRTGTSSVRPGTVRRIASGCLRHFLERGAVDATTGLLTPGWHGPQMLGAQSYIGPSSSYWAAKGFLGLTLDPSHPAWSEDECPAPIDEADFVQVMPGPGWLVQGTRDDGVVRVYNHGSDHFPWFGGPRADPHYRKIGYSTVTGPELTEATDVDSQVVFHRLSGATGLRQRFYRTSYGEQYASSRFFPFELVGGRRIPLRSVPGGADRLAVTLPPSVQISRRPLRIRFGHPRQDWFHVQLDVLSIARLGVEARIVRCVTPDSGLIEVGGFALADEHELEWVSDNVHASAWRQDGMRSTVFALTHPASCIVLQRSGTNAFGSSSATPVLAFEVSAGESLLVAVIALGKRVTVHERCPVTGLEVGERSVTLTWSDQTTHQYCFKHHSWVLERQGRGKVVN